MKNIFTVILTFAITILILLFTLKGNFGSSQNDLTSKLGGYFEASNSTSRYALTTSIVDNESYFLNEKLARFASPDLVSYQNKYISIFTPGVSFVAVPFYMIGKALGLPQLITYTSTLLFALLNLYLIAKIAKKIGASTAFAYLGGFTFVVATNALSYAQTLTQHHFSTAVILLALLNSLSERTILNNILLGILFTAGALFDIPNIILMLPIMIYAFSRHFKTVKSDTQTRIDIKLTFIVIALAMIPLIALFASYNYRTTGSFTMLAQNIGRAESFDKSQEVEVTIEPKGEVKTSIRLPFKTRDGLGGFYILMLSNERSWLMYSPVVLLGLVGAGILYRKNHSRGAVSLFLSIVLINIFIYSLFGDPAGGWSFGPRYLIPSAAILCAVLAYFLTKYRNIFVSILFVLLFLYSVWVSHLGALTSNLIPPKVEAVNLAQPLPYTYVYNMQLMNGGKVGSLLYNTTFQEMSSWTYFYMLVFLSTITGIALYTIGILSKEERS